MWPFRQKIGTDYIRQVIALAERVQQEIAAGNTKNVAPFLQALVKVAPGSLDNILVETQSRELVSTLKNLYVQAVDAQKAWEKKEDLASVNRVLQGIISLQEQVKKGPVRATYTEQGISYTLVTKENWHLYRDGVVDIERLHFGGSDLQESASDFDGYVNDTANAMLVALKDGKVIAFTLGLPLEAEEEVPGVKEDPAFGKGTGFYVTATEALPEYGGKSVAYVLRTMLGQEAARRGYTTLSSNNRQGASTRNALRMGGTVYQTYANYYETGETYYYIVVDLGRYGAKPSQAPVRWVRLNLAPVAQKKDYTCAPAALKAVLQYYGTQADEPALAKRCGTTEKNGTTHDGLVNAAQALGFSVNSKDSASLADIERELRRGAPVIVNYFLPEEDEGHYAVVIGFDESSLFLMDVDGGKYATYPKAAFEQNWFSKRYGPRWMMSIRKPARTAALKRLALHPSNG